RPRETRILRSGLPGPTGPGTLGLPQDDSRNRQILWGRPLVGREPERGRPSEGPPKVRRVEFASVDELTDELGLNELVGPMPADTPRPNTGVDQGLVRGLKAGVIAAISAVVIPGISQFAFSSGKALLSLV